MNGSTTYIDPADIVLQRSLGWPDFHPEDYCHRCGCRNIIWFVDSDRFNLAAESHEIICIVCFVAGHEEATGLRCAWKLVPDGNFSPVEDWENES